MSLNRGNDETQTQKPSIPRGKHNLSGFRLEVNGNCVLVSSLPLEKQQLLTI